MLKYVVSVLVALVLGVFVEHNFKVIGHLQSQCPQLKKVDCEVKPLE